MKHVFYSNTDIKVFKDKFHDMVDSDFRDGSDRVFFGKIIGQRFEIQERIPRGRYSGFSPVIDGIIIPKGQRLRITLKPRLGSVGIFTAWTIVIIGVVFSIATLFSFEDRILERFVGVILATAVILTSSFSFFYSNARQQVEEIKEMFDLENA